MPATKRSAAAGFSWTARRSSPWASVRMASEPATPSNGSNKELKCRTRVASLFPDAASLLRLVTALLCEISTSPHFSHPFYCDWLRPDTAPFRPELSLGRMFQYSSAGTALRKIRPAPRKSRSSRRLVTKGGEKCRLVDHLKNTPQDEPCRSFSNLIAEFTE